MLSGFAPDAAALHAEVVRLRGTGRMQPTVQAAAGTRSDCITWMSETEAASMGLPALAAAIRRLKAAAAALNRCRRPPPPGRLAAATAAAGKFETPPAGRRLLVPLRAMVAYYPGDPEGGSCYVPHWDNGIVSAPAAPRGITHSNKRAVTAVLYANDADFEAWRDGGALRCHLGAPDPWEVASAAAATAAKAAAASKETVAAVTSTLPLSSAPTAAGGGAAPLVAAPAEAAQVALRALQRAAARKKATAAASLSPAATTTAAGGGSVSAITGVDHPTSCCGGDVEEAAAAAEEEAGPPWRVVDVEPIGGRLVLFSSKQILHEVRPPASDAVPQGSAAAAVVRVFWGWSVLSLT